MNQNLKTELLGMEIIELENYLLSLGEAKFRGRQIHKWIYQKGINSFYDMSDLPAYLRQKLNQSSQISIPRVLKQRLSKDGTRKFLLELEDKKKVETVLIPQAGENKRYSLCISTQVGCPVGCSFCATGQSGFQRNLQAYEIAGQFLGSKKELQKRLKNTDEQVITNVVYMGMGEPMLNYNEMIKSIYILNNPKGINIGQRHITISTSGEANGIEKMAAENLQITLAISLHACDNKLRDLLVPMNRKYPLERLMQAAETYVKQTNRRITFEYLMLDEVNISRRDADKMIKMLKPMLANVNLIPYNEVEGLPYKKPSTQKVSQFFQYLSRGGLNVTLRDERGGDIEAACGQLRSQV